jgi:hypothetical protein
MSDDVGRNAAGDRWTEDPFQEFGEAYIKQTKEEGLELAEPDSCVMPLGPIGHVDEVNGPGAGIIKGFLPTKSEVVELAKHYAEIQIDQYFEWWLFGSVGSSQTRRVAFAGLRLKRMDEYIGQEEVQKAYDATLAEYAKRQDADLWARYKRGEKAPPIDWDDKKGWWGLVEEGLENLLRELLHLSSVKEVDQQSLLKLRPLRADLLELLERMKGRGDMTLFWDWDSPTTLTRLVGDASREPGGKKLAHLLTAAMPPTPGGLFDLLHIDIRRALDDKSA